MLSNGAEEQEDLAQSNDFFSLLSRLAIIPPVLAGWPADLTTSTFNRLGQYASSPDYRANCHTELAVSSLMVAKRPSPVLILPTYMGMARLS